MSRPTRPGDQITPQALRAPVKIHTAVEEITDRLITAIAIGELLPGSRLPSEREMAAMLQVSRNTLREAVARLVAMEIVEIRRGRTGGAFVTTSWTQASADSVQRTLAPRQAELAELFDLCSIVEGAVARAAAERRTKDQIIVIKDALDGFANAKGPAEEQATDHVFHKAIMDAAGNPRLTALNQDLIAKTNLGFPLEPWRDPELGGDGSRRALEDHTALADAIERGDPEAAGRVAQSHSYISAEIIQQTLERADQVLRTNSSPVEGDSRRWT
jgi:GntR family transcriptional repressor for pyruvate dehydrogenase complex